MTLNDPIAMALSKMQNVDKLGKETCVVGPSSKLLKKILTIMQDHQFVGEFKESHEQKGGVLTVNLLNKINKCGVIKPRFAVGKDDFVKFEKRYLPAQGFGSLIVSTSQGLMTIEDAKAKNIGGRLVSFFY